MREIIKNITILRKQLEKSIKQNGLNSKITMELSDNFNNLINQYYEQNKEIKFPTNSKMNYFYKIAYEKLKEITENNKKFPTVKQWNRLAMENNLLSNISLEYISNLDWNYLQIKVEREINFKIRLENDI